MSTSRTDGCDLDPGEGKTKSRASFHCTPELRALLEVQRDTRARNRATTGQIVPWVFCHRTAAASRTSATRGRKACEAAGVPGRLVHDFRRTAVRNLERAGVPRSSAMKMTGHRTEAVYAQIRDQRIPRCFGKPPQNWPCCHAQRDPSVQVQSKVRTLSTKTRPMNRPSKSFAFPIAFKLTREWRNGRRAGLRIRCRKAWGFKSPLSHPLRNKDFLRQSRHSRSDSGRPSAHLLPTSPPFRIGVPSTIFASRSTAPPPLAFLNQWL